jgi:hypothetical protein
MTDTEQEFTIAEAARELGVVEKRLRRLIDSTGNRDRTGTAQRQTRTGTRTVTVLSSPLLEELRACLQSQQNGDSRNGDRDTSERGQSLTRTRTSGGELSLSAKNALLASTVAERDQTIARQDAEIAFLRAQVDRLTAPKLSWLARLFGKREKKEQG